MYAVLVKNDETSWDVVHTLPPYFDAEKQINIDNAFLKDSSIIGMETTSYKNTAKLNAVWDGTSFSGGNTPAQGLEPIDIWDTHKKFSFLSENVIIANFVIKNTSSKSEFLSAAFENEVTLFPIPSDQALIIGETYTIENNRFIKQ